MKSKLLASIALTLIAAPLAFAQPGADVKTTLQKNPHNGNGVIISGTVKSIDSSRREIVIKDDQFPTEFRLTAPDGNAFTEVTEGAKITVTVRNNPKTTP